MAIDTAAKRFSIGNPMCPWRRTGSVPTGTSTANSRRTTLYLYWGWPAAPVTDLVGGGRAVTLECAVCGASALEASQTGAQTAECAG